jgi:hypothetical protein
VYVVVVVVVIVVVVIVVAMGCVRGSVSKKRKSSFGA